MMTEHASIPTLMRTAALALLAEFGERQRAVGCLPFADTPARQRFTYLPRPRQGVCLADLDRAGRKAAHRLLATALSSQAYAQAAAVMAMEEVLDRQEEWRRGRHSSDFWVVVFGDPARDERWAWRWEGHHLSVSVTLDDQEVFPTPLFLGAHPADISVAGQAVMRPLGVEEDLARALMDAMGPAARSMAVVADTAPPDIHSSTRPHVGGQTTPLGIGAAQLNPVSRTILDQLAAVYLGRLPDELAAREAARLNGTELHFAWEGALQPGSGHYYRVQGPDLLIEYDNTSHGANHAHTVLRCPARDFGGNVLATRERAEHAVDEGTG